jgi:hypothetical protein
MVAHLPSRRQVAKSFPNITARPKEYPYPFTDIDPGRIEGVHITRCTIK